MKKEKKNEEKVETPVVSIEEENQKLEKSLDVIKLSKEEPEKPFDEAVEEKRKNIFVTYRKARRNNNIIMVVTVAIFTAAMILMVTYPGWGQIVGGVAIGVTVLFLIVHYILTRNLFPNTTKEYIRFFMETVDNYTFNFDELYDAKLLFEKRYTLADVLTDRVYKDVIDSASRNIVDATYKEKPFELGELALYKQGAKRYQKAVIFVGKYLTKDNNFHFEDRYIVNIRGEKPTDLPNDIDDLVILSEQNNFVIYGKEGANYQKDLGKDLINNLKSIECTGCLLNVNVVFWAGHTSCYLSYDDSIVAIPFDHEFNVASANQLKKNVKEILEILE